MIGDAAKLTWRVKVKYPVKVFCRVHLETRSDVFVDSTTARITPMLGPNYIYLFHPILAFYVFVVWFTGPEPLHLEGRYCGQRAVLKCQAQKAKGVKGAIRYV